MYNFRTNQSTTTKCILYRVHYVIVRLPGEVNSELDTSYLANCVSDSAVCLCENNLKIEEEENTLNFFYVANNKSFGIGIDTTTWEAAADDRGHWRSVVKAGMGRGEEKRSVHETVKREKRKQKSSHHAHSPQPTNFICLTI